MITPPRRSVTRFFIPLIDVLILLFAIFLLMPFVSAPAQPDDKPDPKEKPKELPADVTELRRQLADARKEADEAKRRLERFQKERGERYVVRTVEIDPGTGELYYYAPDRQRVPTEKMDEWIAYQKRLAGEKDVYFVIQYPRRGGAHPTRADVDRYRDWFKGTEYGFDVPRAGF